MNPHNALKKTCHPGGWCGHHDEHEPLWKCQYCRAAGTIDAVRAVACTYVYPPCEHCGQTPECAPDCAGIAAALGAPGVRVIGSPD